MKNGLLIIFVLPLFLLCGKAKSQDSSRLRISLLTCAPGEELYSTFGHSALRVTDSSSHSDWVFNYGTFDFTDPDFYLKFIKGKLRYFLSVSEYGYFMEEFWETRRNVQEQELSLLPEEKIAIFNFLKAQLAEDKKFYQYDFFFDNCTTRLRDLIQRQKMGILPFRSAMPVGTTFRNAIHLYLDKNQQDWSKWGIDLLLGAHTDAVMTPAQTLFLPDNLLLAFDSSKYLVSQKTDLNPVPAKTRSAGGFWTPMAVNSLLLVLVLIGLFVEQPVVKNVFNVLRGLLFFTIGLLGVLLVFMWTGTDHLMCENNYNLLWAWPTHFIAAFFLHTRKTWVRWYATFVLIELSLLLLSWFFLPQQLNLACLPLVLLLMGCCVPLIANKK